MCALTRETARRQGVTIETIATPVERLDVPAASFAIVYGVNLLHKEDQAAGPSQKRGERVALLSPAGGSRRGRDRCRRGGVPARWSSFLGCRLICLGLVGEYVGGTFEEVKGRPLYFVRSTLDDSKPEAGAVAGPDR